MRPRVHFRGFVVHSIEIRMNKWKAFVALWDIVSSYAALLRSLVKPDLQKSIVTHQAIYQLAPTVGLLRNSRLCVRSDLKLQFLVIFMLLDGD